VFDYVLIVVAGMAMLSQAILGLLVTTRPPSEQRRLWYEMAFSAIGIIGVGAVVWGGVRTAETSNYIKFGVSHIEQMGVATGDLLKRQFDILTAEKMLLDKESADHVAQLRQRNLAANVARAAPAISGSLPPVAASTTYDAGMSEAINRVRESVKKSQALVACRKAKMPVFMELVGLISSAVGYQNNLAYTRDGELLQRQYQTWLGAVREFLSEHKDMLRNVEAFDRVKDRDMGPSFLLFLSSGVDAWHNFEDRRKVLFDIEQEFGNRMCMPDDLAAMANGSSTNQ
jgi:hypothetical protein